MTNELAKKLKDAGFPQGKNWTRGVNVGEGDVVEFAFEPNLSELIGTCGDKFSQLAWINESIKWQAVAAKDRTAKKLICLQVGHGETPEEAVANLWLAING